jgi:hypothetical protein
VVPRVADPGQRPAHRHWQLYKSTQFQSLKKPYRRGMSKCSPCQVKNGPVSVKQKPEWPKNASKRIYLSTAIALSKRQAGHCIATYLGHQQSTCLQQ